MIAGQRNESHGGDLAGQNRPVHGLLDQQEVLDGKAAAYWYDHSPAGLQLLLTPSSASANTDQMITQCTQRGVISQSCPIPRPTGGPFSRNIWPLAIAARVLLVMSVLRLWTAWL